MTSKRTCGFIFNRRASSISILIIALLNITTVITPFVNNGNIALAQSSQPQRQNLLPSSSSSQQPTTHEYTLIAENTTLEIAPGFRVDAWTYNGTMPGPTITAIEGDRVIIHFINKTPLPHTIHLHGDHPSEQDGVSEVIGPQMVHSLMI